MRVLIVILLIPFSLFAGKDAAVTGVVTPADSTWLMVGQEHEVTITFHNNGTDTLDTIPVLFQVGSAVIHDTIIGPIAPDSSFNFTFSDSLTISDTLSSIGQARVNCPGDTNAFNDVFIVYYNATGLPVVKEEQFRMHPNPVPSGNVVIINDQEAALYRLDGRRVDTRVTNGYLQTQGLKSGSYLVVSKRGNAILIVQ